MRSRTELELELARMRLRVGRAEGKLSEAKSARDSVVVELRRLPDPPSLKTVAALAGISDAWVHKIEKEAD